MTCHQGDSLSLTLWGPVHSEWNAECATSGECARTLLAALCQRFHLYLQGFWMEAQVHHRGTVMGHGQTPRVSFCPLLVGQLRADPNTICPSSKDSLSELVFPCILRHKPLTLQGSHLTALKTPACVGGSALPFLAPGSLSGFDEPALAVSPLSYFVSFLFSLLNPYKS